MIPPTPYTQSCARLLISACGGDWNLSLLLSGRNEALRGAEKRYSLPKQELPSRFFPLSFRWLGVAPDAQISTQTLRRGTLISVIPAEVSELSKGWILR